GEEFLILAPHTDPADAVALAERIRTGVESGGFRLDGTERRLSVTCSLGTAGTRTFPVDPDGIVALADAACYGAKRAGRNRVLTAELPALA
ncbi:MAG TPA: diguanylate cyclase, partial [Thermoanaerobaculia bacterium]|nr:diguanylate cyclase [Thermoanaerobaculia bacterium]